ncbi:MAG: segregation and condensation protein A [Chitinivibrionales bacterium]
MEPKKEYTVKLDLFEGPLDLLLYLINKSEMAILDISVAQITKQYLSYLDVMRRLNIDIASEYLSMAATLIRLKAREMLPQNDDEELDEEEGIFNKQQLIEQLLEYKKYKEAANSLRVYESEQFGSFTRGKAEEIELDHRQEQTVGDIGVFDLITAFRRILERSKEQEPERGHVLVAEPVRLDDRIEHVLGCLQESEEVCFEELFSDDLRRIVVVVTFMAILELVKMQEIYFRQEEAFGNIFVKKRSTRDRS